MDAIVDRFVAALGDLHSTRDVGPLVELFAEDATLRKLGMPHEEHGEEGARSFWRQHRDVFGSVDASFQHVASSDGIAFLEWTSEGTLSSGADFRYEGVSVLEAHGDAIDSFRTYYDTAAFLGQRS
jgi:ketosteroid isomerase-like protein